MTKGIFYYQKKFIYFCNKKVFAETPRPMKFPKSTNVSIVR